MRIGMWIAGGLAALSVALNALRFLGAAQVTAQMAPTGVTAAPFQKITVELLALLAGSVVGLVLAHRGSSRGTILLACVGVAGLFVLPFLWPSNVQVGNSPIPWVFILISAGFAFGVTRAADGRVKLFEDLDYEAEAVLAPRLERLRARLGSEAAADGIGSGVVDDLRKRVDDAELMLKGATYRIALVREGKARRNGPMLDEIEGGIRDVRRDLEATERLLATGEEGARAGSIA